MISVYTEMTTEELGDYMGGDARGGQTKKELEVIVMVILNRLAKAQYEIANLRTALLGDGSVASDAALWREFKEAAKVAPKMVTTDPDTRTWTEIDEGHDDSEARAARGLR